MANGFIRGILFTVLAVASAASAQSRKPPLLDLASDTVARRVSTSSAQVTFKQAADPSRLDIAIAAGKDGYPGITIKPDGPAWNLAAYGHVEAKITNTGSAEIAVTVRVDNDADWHLNPWSAETLYLKPGDTETAHVRFGVAWGKRGYALNPAKISQILVFAAKSDAAKSFRIESLEAGGTPGETPPVPPDQIRIVPPHGVLLGKGTTVDAAKQVQSRAATATIIPQPDGQALRIAATQEADAEVSLKPVAGRWNLRNYLDVTIHLRNSGKVPVGIRAAIDQWADGSQSADISLAPDEQQDVVIPFARTSIWNGDHNSGSPVESDAVGQIKLRLLPGAAGREVTIDSIRASLGAPAQIPDWLGTRPPTPGKWTRTFDENFPGSTIDASHWSIYGENYWDKQSHFSRDNVIVSGGMARMRFEKKRGRQNDDPKRNENDYATGFLSTDGKWAQRYGYFEARMKLPTAPGLWPAFWMMPDRGPKSRDRGTTADGGMEFDIMEYLTRYGPYRYNIAMHWDGYGKDHKSTGTDHIYVHPDKDGFITSGMLWEPGRLTFYCNGTPVATWENPRVSNVPEYIMFTLPSGGWGGNDLDDTGLPDNLTINYVRAWQREDLAAIPSEQGAK